MLDQCCGPLSGRPARGETILPLPDGESRGLLSEHLRSRSSSKPEVLFTVWATSYLVGVGLSLVATAVAQYVLRCERAPETEGEPVERAAAGLPRA